MQFCLKCAGEKCTADAIYEPWYPPRWSAALRTEILPTTWVAKDTHRDGRQSAELSKGSLIDWWKIHLTTWGFQVMLSRVNCQLWAKETSSLPLSCQFGYTTAGCDSWDGCVYYQLWSSLTWELQNLPTSICDLLCAVHLPEFRFWSNFPPIRQSNILANSEASC